MTITQRQTAIIQSPGVKPESLPLALSDSVPVPQPQSAHEILVRVLAVSLNPTDHKMVRHFPMEGNLVGCDFCGIVESTAMLGDATGGGHSPLPLGTRVCGAVFPYRPEGRPSGSFAQWVVTDWRCLLRVPAGWSDLEGAALGGVGWSTVAQAISDPEALALQGRPGSTAKGTDPVLVYGGATATGTMACQMLKL